MLPRARRLPRAGFAALSRARRLDSPHFKVAWSLGVRGCAVVVPKKVAPRAVDRNLLKRRVLALVAARYRDGGALVVFAKPGSRGLSMNSIRQELEPLFATLTRTHSPRRS
jgi:ribonuclease P protein component